MSDTEAPRGNPLICAGPGPHEPADGVLGVVFGIPASLGAVSDGSVCPAPNCQPPEPEPESDPAAELAALQQAIASASTLEEVQQMIHGDDND